MGLFFHIILSFRQELSDPKVANYNLHFNKISISALFGVSENLILEMCWVNFHCCCLFSRMMLEPCQPKCLHLQMVERKACFFSCQAGHTCHLQLLLCKFIIQSCCFSIQCHDHFIFHDFVFLNEIPWLNSKSKIVHKMQFPGIYQADRLHLYAHLLMKTITLTTKNSLKM